MGAVLQLDHAPASLLGEKDAPPPVAPPSTGDPAAAQPGPAYDEEFAKKLVLYACKTLADLTSEPAMQASEFELALITPPLTAAINKFAPKMAAGDGKDPTVVFLAVALLFMVIRRGALLRKRAAAAAQAKQRAQAGVDTTPHAPTTPANGHVPIILGGTLGNGQL